MNPTLIIAAVSAAIAGSAGFGTAWTLQGRAIDKIKLEHSDATIQQQRAARQAIERSTLQVITAQNEAATRNTRIAADSRRAGDAGNGLRIASADAAAHADDHADACRAIVAAYGQLLDEGSRLLEEVATVADQCISDNKALTDGWPR